MTLQKRILDMLPALTAFAAVAAFGTYVAIAYVLHDPWWLHTVEVQRAVTSAHHAAGAAHSAMHNAHRG